MSFMLSKAVFSERDEYLCPVPELYRWGSWHWKNSAAVIIIHNVLTCEMQSIGDTWSDWDKDSLCHKPDFSSASSNCVKMYAFMYIC